MPRGYTLVEIMMVLTFVAMAIGYLLSRVDFTSYRMDANVRLLQNIVIGAQQTAIQRNTDVQVMFDAEAHRVRVLQDFNANGVMDGSDSARYRPLQEGAQFQAPPTTLDGAAAAYMTGAGVIETGNPLQLAIRIAPNGSLSGDAVVYIGSAKRDPKFLRAMTIVGATARTGFWSRASGSWRARDN